MATLDLAANLIKQFEGCSLRAYPDPLSGGDPFTIGYGTTRHMDGSAIRPGETISQSEAEALLARDVEIVVANLAKTVPYWGEMAPEQQAALVDFGYNLGSGFMQADGFNTIQSRLSDKDWTNVPDALLLYCNPGTDVEEGLKRRRAAEGELWRSGKPMPNGPLSSVQRLRIVALKQTWLKKTTDQASSLPDNQKKQVQAGQFYDCVDWKESPASRSHHQVTLAYDAGTWFVYTPDWEPWGKPDQGFAIQNDNVRDFTAHVSRYFTWGEVWQYDSTRITNDFTIISNIKKLALLLDNVRQQFGPIGVSSWYRNPAANAKVGGKPNSAHMQGWAADIYLINEDSTKLENWLVDNWDGGVGKGIASGRGYIHVDLGPKRNWTY